MNTDNKQSLSAVALAAIGVVYGDIDTGPLYILHEYLPGQFGSGVERNAVFSFLSLIFRLLIFVVSIKYLTFVMRADNASEGEILTLMLLAERNASAQAASVSVIMGLVGGNFFYGKVVTTPVISMMPTTEDLETVAPQLDTWIVPLSVIVLTLLSMIQRHGTAMVGRLFMSITLTWFLISTGLGLRSIIANPEVLHALNPMWAIHLFLKYEAISSTALRVVVLPITRVETLYIDMGRFDKFPICLAWFTVVLPFLTLNCFGQRVLLLKNPEAIRNPFFLLAPDWALIPLLIIAALATVIASQTVISGIFLLACQAARLGYLLPVHIIHTSETESGQIYIPFVNWMLYIMVVIVIVSFKHSSNLAAIYGIMVTGTMMLMSILSATVAHQNWRWSKYFVALVLTALLCVDIPLFAANFDKPLSGGWLPLSLDTVMFIVMTIQKSEHFRLLWRIHEYGNFLEAMVASLEKPPSVHVSGTAVYISCAINVIPLAPTHNLKCNKVLHERVVLLTLRTEDAPYVHNVHRAQAEQLSSTSWRVTASYG